MGQATGKSAHPTIVESAVPLLGERRLLMSLEIEALCV